MRIAKLFFIITAATLAGNASAKDTTLHLAAREDNVAYARWILDRGVDVNAKDAIRRTPLHWAAVKNAAEVAKLLIDNGAEVNAKDKKGWTPLHLATSEDTAEVAKLLIDSGAEVNAKDKKGWTPLHWATSEGAAEVAKLLIDSGVEVNAKDKNGRMPLHLAARYDNAAEVVKLLIDSGAKVNAKNNDNETPLDVARDRNATAVAKLLADKAETAQKRTGAKGKCGETLTKIDEAIRQAAEISQEATPLAGLRHDILKLALTQAQRNLQSDGGALAHPRRIRPPPPMSAAKRHCN